MLRQNPPAVGISFLAMFPSQKVGNATNQEQLRCFLKQFYRFKEVTEEMLIMQVKMKSGRVCSSGLPGRWPSSEQQEVASLRVPVQTLEDSIVRKMRRREWAPRT